MFKEYKEESDKRNTEIKKLSMMLAIAILFLVPLSIFFINAYAQTEPPSTSDQLGGIVASATALIATVGIIIGLISKLFKKFAAEKIATNEMYAKVADVMDSMSGSLEATDKGIRDNMDVVGLAIGTILNNPEIKTKLGTAESQKVLSKIQTEIDAWNNDIRKYYDTINPKVPNDEGDQADTTVKLAKVKAKSIPQ